MNMEFKGLIPALQSKRIDIINSAMYIRAEREEQVDFVPYMTVGNEIVVQAKNPEGHHRAATTCVAARRRRDARRLPGELAREDDENCRKAGKAGVNVMTFPTAQDAALALKNGRADAIYNSTPGAYKQVQELPNDYAIAGKTFGPFAKIGIAVRKGDAAHEGGGRQGARGNHGRRHLMQLLKKNGMPARRQAQLRPAAAGPLQSRPSWTSPGWSSTTSFRRASYGARR